VRLQAALKNTSALEAQLYMAECDPPDLRLHSEWRTRENPHPAAGRSHSDGIDGFHGTCDEAKFGWRSAERPSIQQYLKLLSANRRQRCAVGDHYTRPSQRNQVFILKITERPSNRLPCGP
jgi:hypothetical protein